MYYLIETKTGEDMRLFSAESLMKAQDGLRRLILEAMEVEEESAGLEDIVRDFVFVDRPVSDAASRRQTTRLSIANMGATYISPDEADAYSWEIMAEGEVRRL